jgi:hypothetical protein
MMQDTETWSPEQELRLLEELAEAEAQAFDEMELDVPIRSFPAEPERPWIAYWSLPGRSMGAKVRSAQRVMRSR